MKGKAHLSLKTFKDVKDYRMGFYRYIGSGRKTKATTDEGHGKGWVFICKVCCQLALVSVPSSGIWMREVLFIVEDN